MRENNRCQLEKYLKLYHFFNLITRDSRMDIDIDSETEIGNVLLAFLSDENSNEMLVKK